MHTKSARNAAVKQTVSAIKAALHDGVTVPALEEAKALLMALCARTELFPRSAFPVPAEELIYRTFLIHEEPDGEYALYVNSSLPGQESPPHTHGGSWAIVAAVDGEETHRLYVEDETSPGSDGGGIRQVRELTVKPGAAVSMMPEGIHSIHATTSKPLLHLHLYGRSFATQGARKKFDLESGTVTRFKLEEVGLIEDAR